MSAYIVHSEHIRVLVWAGLNYSRPGSPMTWHVPDPENAVSPETVHTSFGTHYRQLTHETAEAVGQILLDENVRSVNHRYNEDEGYVYEHAAPEDRRWTPAEILKAIDCYEYQACETREWTASEAYSIITGLRSTLIHTMPGYDDGPWEIVPGMRPHAVEQAMARRAEAALKAERG